MDDRPHTSRQRHAALERESTQYDRDLYGWAVEQAALLRAGRVSEADARNIAEELDDVGNEQYHKLESALRIILLHLLKWDHQPQRRTRSWWSSITVQRNQLDRVLRRNPGLKPRVAAAIEAAYKDARAQALAQTRVSPRVFPARCPYSWKEVRERPIPWQFGD